VIPRETCGCEARPGDDAARDEHPTRRQRERLYGRGSSPSRRHPVLLERVPADPPDDGQRYAATRESLHAWISHHWKEWYESPTAECGGSICLAKLSVRRRLDPPI